MKTAYWFIISLFLTGCIHQSDVKTPHPAWVLMQQHLDAISNKDLVGLARTLSPDGEMQLILPQTEIIHGVDAFLKFHQDWFAQPDWTFETQILNGEVGENMAMMVVEVMYRERSRQGMPYYNQMIVSYDLKKIDRQWFVIKDHASSVKKSTDQ